MKTIELAKHLWWFRIEKPRIFRCFKGWYSPNCDWGWRLEPQTAPCKNVHRFLWILISKIFWRRLNELFIGISDMSPTFNNISSFFRYVVKMWWLLFWPYPLQRCHIPYKPLRQKVYFIYILVRSFRFIWIRYVIGIRPIYYLILSVRGSTLDVRIWCL